MGAFLSNTADDDKLDRAYDARAAKEKADDIKERKIRLIVGIGLIIIGIVLIIVYELIPDAHNDYCLSACIIAFLGGVVQIMISIDTR